MDYILENDFLRATVRSKGAELSSVQNKRTGEEMMWQADPAVWPRCAPMLFPYCGRLKDGAYTWQGVRYEGGQHGFARDMEHTLEASAPGELTLCLEANALTMEKFPFPFQLRSTFTLEENRVCHRVCVTNDGDAPLRFGFGYHPGFACPFDAQHTVEDYSIVFERPETPTVVDTSPVTGLCTGRNYTYFEDGVSIPLTDHLFDADSLCFSGLRSSTLSLEEAGTGRRVSVDIEGFPYVLVWSAKGPLQFLCVEPWHTLPDAENATGRWEDKAPAITVEPGEEWTTKLVTHFER